MDHTRDPCPWVILNDFGGAFAMGAIGGTLWHGIKGFRNSPRNAIIAGFFTGGSLAIRGGYKAARNGAIGCAVLLAVIEGVGIGFQKMFAGSTKLEMPQPPPSDGAMV
ncbi:hypothetical protein K4K61_012419 [Colletotrichum sp. SAR11_59]|nr:hypothetical protein K4K61_012419 [Colletotrichum sp. SAR11_59]